MVSGVGIDMIDLSDFGRTLKRSGERFILHPTDLYRG